MATGPFTRKLQFLRGQLMLRVATGDPLSLEELAQVAAILEALEPISNAMESRPVPLGWRVLDGGRGSAA